MPAYIKREFDRILSFTCKHVYVNFFFALHFYFASALTHSHRMRLENIFHIYSEFFFSLHTFSCTCSITSQCFNVSHRTIWIFDTRLCIYMWEVKRRRDHLSAEWTAAARMKKKAAFWFYFDYFTVVLFAMLRSGYIDEFTVVDVCVCFNLIDVNKFSEVYLECYQFWHLERGGRQLICTYPHTIQINYFWICQLNCWSFGMPSTAWHRQRDTWH